MKNSMILFLLALASIFSAQANDVCEAPKKGIRVKVEHVYPTDVGPDYCFVSNLETGRRYAVSDCGINVVSVGDVLVGTVYTYWTHKDETGKPVCDYQDFTINF